jgi:hypothetical protein
LLVQQWVVVLALQARGPADPEAPPVAAVVVVARSLPLA